MILLLLVVGVLVFFGLVVFLTFGGLFKVESDQKKAENDAPRILDVAFDGRPMVSFHAHMRTLKYETVIMGAKERGYNLTHQSEGQYGTLIFEKAAPVVVTPDESAVEDDVPEVRP